MSSQDENYSDEAISTDEWPDDYFDIDCDAYTPKPKYPPSTATFADLPMDVLRLIVGPLALRDRCRALRSNRALREAVSLSTWSNVGNGKLIVTAVETFKDTGVAHRLMYRMAERHRRVQEPAPLEPIPKELFIQLGICGLHTIRHDGDFVGDLARYRRLGAKMHLDEIRLNNVNFNVSDERLRIINDFIDEHCIFEKLTIMRLEQSPLSERARELIARARGEVVLEMRRNEMTDEELLSIERPVKIFLEERAQGFRRSLMTTALLIELVHRGHSIVDFESDISSTETLREVVERVSSSPSHQKVLIHVQNFSMVKSYIEAVEAEIEFGPHHNMHMATSSYFHLGANIQLTQYTIPRRGVIQTIQKARVEIKSENYPEEIVQQEDESLLSD